jgi:hypothetical protein
MKEYGLLQSLGIFQGFVVYFCYVWSGLDLIVIIFWKPRVMLQFFHCVGTAVQFTRTSQAYSQKARNMDFLGFNSQQEILWTGSTVGGVLGSTVDRRRCEQGVQRRFADARCTCALCRQCSSVVAGEDEEDEP